MKQFVFLLFPLFISCSYEKDPGPIVHPDSDSVRIEKSYAALNLYPSGKILLQKISQLQGQGLQLTVQFQKATDMRTLSESVTSEGYFLFSQGVYKVIINGQLDSSTTTHILAHELAHIVDDYEIDLVVNQYSGYEALIRSTIQHLQAGEIKQLDSTHVSYVLNTLFCAEARAYSYNKKLIDEGLYNSKLSLVTSQLAEHIDSSYIQRFQTSFGSNKETMLNWCLQFHSMTEIQDYLITKINN